MYSIGYDSPCINFVGLLTCAFAHFCYVWLMSLIFFKSFLWIVLLKYKPFFLLFHAVSSVNLLLYKQLPSKVKILSLVLIV